MISPLAQVQESAVQPQQQQQAQQQQAQAQQSGSGTPSGAMHVQMLDSQQIIKYEIIEAPSPTGGASGTNTVTVSTGHVGAITPTSNAGAVVVTSNGDGNGSDQMEWRGRPPEEEEEEEDFTSHIV